MSFPKTKADWQFLLTELSTKLTVWLALAAAGISQLIDNAESLSAQFPSIVQYLPQGKTASTVAHAAITILGILAALARIRRAWVSHVSSK